MKKEIRPYQPKDLSDLLSTWEAASRLAHPFMLDDFFVQERENIPKFYLPNTDTWVVTIDEKVVGFIALIVSKSNTEIACEIGGLFVAPSFHRHGLGKSLIDSAAQQYGHLRVKVFKDNMIGRKFYQKYGFEFIEELVWENTGDILFYLKLRTA
ncbi:GNAT family N-acetyltransferase [Colwelliaceae bacterium 6441]